MLKLTCKGLGLVVAATLLAAPAAHANPRLWWQGVDGNGHPQINNHLGEPGAPVKWQACIESGSPVVATCDDPAATGPVLEPGPTATGTYFLSSSSPGTFRVSGRWQGQLVKLSDPSLTGTPKVGAKVTVSPARWSGGWYAASDNALWSCATAEGTGCERLAWQSATLGAEQEGRYLFATGWYLRGTYGLEEPPVTQVSIDHPVAGPYGPVAAGTVAPAPTPTPGTNPRTFWQGVDANGDPQVNQHLGEPGAPVDWQACTDGGCVKLDGTGPVLEPGPTAVGTAFMALSGTLNFRGSSRWLGRLTRIADPALTGDLAVGATVTVQPGRWSGGWSDRTDGALLSCETPAGDGCRLLAQDRAQLGEAEAGRYLFATAWYLRGTYGLEEPPASQRSIDHLVAGPYGPVPAPPVQEGAPPVTRTATVAAPTVKLRARALRGKGRLNLGGVTCARSCRVSLKVVGGGKKAYTRTFVAKRGVTAITAPQRRGKLTVRVRVDGKLLAKQRIVAR